LSSRTEGQKLIDKQNDIYWKKPLNY
jgi:hypothetical protein